MNPKKLVLSNGREFYGEGLGDEVIAELVFNTSMVGYQEIISDPSYTGQIVVMSYPLIGNYGTNDEDFESKDLHVEGLIVKDCQAKPSNFRYTNSLTDLLEEHNIPLLCNIDTRELVRIIRDYGSMIGIITDADTETSVALEKIKDYVVPHNQVSLVSTKRPILSKAKKPRYQVVCLDFGIKQNIVKNLNMRNCNVTLLPYNSSVEDIIKYKPDGLFLSNGPGDPTDNKEAIQAVASLKGKLPIFGICLGHQIMALASNAKTVKMKFGHRGSNHPVKNILTGKIEITSQNHSYMVDYDSLRDTDLEVTHINLLDNSVEGLYAKDKMFQSIQYHPESAAGPEDSSYLFDEFIKSMKAFKEMN